MQSNLLPLPIAVVAAALTFLPADLAAQPNTGKSFVERAGEWKFEELHLKNGKEHRGLIRTIDDDEIDFIDIVRQPGKKMYLVLISFDPRSVQSTVRLSAAERNALFARIEPLLTHKSYALIEAGRMEDVELTETRRGGTTWHTCEQPWFSVESTADDESTRRCVVRIEQIFRAFRRVLPPRVERRGDVRVLLFGSMDEYHSHLRQAGMAFANPAYYSAATNTIVAGSDLRIYSRRHAQVRAECTALRQRYEKQNREFTERMVALTAQLKKQGFNAQEIAAEQRIRKAAWEREYTMMVGADGEGGKVAEVLRRNNDKFDEVTGEMFRRLYHEAFHAYLENYVFPHDGTSMPRWLNEGLAQIFENGQLDDDTLRLDAPRREDLLALQSDLLGKEPLALSQVIVADPRAYMVPHGDAQASRRHYLYSWGLAWYLTFEHDLLGSADLDRYVNADQAAPSPIIKFERLVAQHLEDFEARWRQRMLQMSPPPK